MDAGSRARRFAGLAAATLALTVPAAAHAADAYVDFDTGSDILPCGAIGDPCKTLATGLGQTGAGETMRVDDSATEYAAIADVGGGRSVIAENFVIADFGPTTIDGAGSYAIRVLNGDPAGTIKGFHLQSINASGSVTLFDDATVTGNVFDEPGGPDGVCQLTIGNAGNNSTISGNSFIDPSPAVTPKAGVCIGMSATPSVSGNFFTGLNRGVSASGGNAALSFNTFTGIRVMHAIGVTAGTPTLTANVITAPGDAGAEGIFISNSTGGATLRRNLILGHNVGVTAYETAGPVDLNGDLIAGNATYGLNHVDIAGGTGSEGNVTATNVTIFGTVGSDVNNVGAHLTLNSSIIGNDPNIGASSTCAISFSRGPMVLASLDGCSAFQTIADPAFVNPAANNYHLAAGSPMIDMGDPAGPLAGILDLDGEARATDGNGDGTVRRDIGADESAGVPGPVQPVPPATVTPVKRCKTGFKLKTVKTKSGKKKKKCVRKKKRRK